MTTGGPHDEAARLRLLDDYGVLDTAPDDTLNGIVALASAICEAPISLVSLVDETRQWFKAKVGLDATETPREHAFCAHAIGPGREGIFTVEDARAHPQFLANPLVTGDPSVVFYAGAPLVVEGGAKLGTLCVIDRKPRTLTPVQRLALTTLAGVVVKHLQHRRDLAESEAVAARLQTALTSIGDAVVTTDVQGRITFLNPAAETLTGWRAVDAVGTPSDAVLHLHDEGTRRELPSPVERVLRSASGNAVVDNAVLVSRDGREIPVDDSAAPLRNRRGEVSGVILVLRDQTDVRRRVAERDRLMGEVAVARSRLALLIDEAPAFVCTLRGPDHVFELVNRPYQQLIGARRELVGRRVADALPEVTSQGFVSLLDRVYGAGTAFRGNELPLELDRRGDGTLERAYVNFVYQPSRNGDGEVDGIDVFGFDVTEQVEARQRIEALVAQLEVERHRLEIVVGNSPAAIAIWRGEDLVFEMVNAGYQAIFPDRQLLRRKLLEALPELVGQDFPEILGAVYQTGTPFVGQEVELQMTFREGAASEMRHFDVIYVRIDNPDGSPYGVYNSALDVSERVRARLQLEQRESELRKSQDRVRSIVDAAGAKLWELDARTGEMVDDVRMVELTGLPLGSTFSLSSALSSLPFAEDRARVASAIKAALDGRDGGRYLCEFRTEGSNGAPVRWVESRAQAYFDDQGMATRLAGAMIDITARKEADDEKQRSAERVTQILDAMSDGFFTVDDAWRITTVNRTFEKMLHLRRDEILGKVLWDVFPEVREARGEAWTQLQTCLTERVPVEFVSKHPSLDLWTDTRANPTDDGGMAAFFRDVTLPKRAENALQQQAAFERQLIGIVSHDLRNPLNVIGMASQLLRRQDNLSAAAAQHIVRIQNATERSSRMIRDLLDFTQARLGGGIRIERRPGDLHALTRAVMDEVEAAYPDRRLNVRAEGDGRGEWDEGRLGQLVQNLVTNALKYSPGESAVDVTTRGDDSFVTLTVGNVGEAIPQAILPVIFEPFERGAAHTDTAVRSVGLGLYIVKKVVEAHGGAIEVRSLPAEGTTFRVTLPRSTGSSAE